MDIQAASWTVIGDGIISGSMGDEIPSDILNGVIVLSIDRNTGNTKSWVRAVPGLFKHIGPIFTIAAIGKITGMNVKRHSLPKCMVVPKECFDIYVSQYLTYVHSEK